MIQKGIFCRYWSVATDSTNQPSESAQGSTIASDSISEKYEIAYDHRTPEGCERIQNPSLWRNF
jgi:hypothetical protein